MIQYQLTDLARRYKEQGICDCTPVRGTDLAAGMDLKACLPKSIAVMPYSTTKIMTGVKIFLGADKELLTDVIHAKYPDNFRAMSVTLCGLYLPRSSNKGLQLENTVGLLDSDFMGESFVKLYNKTEDPIIIFPGARVVQLVIVPAIISPWEEVSKFSIMSEEGRVLATTQRGEGGDGSTGR